MAAIAACIDGDGCGCARWWRRWCLKAAAEAVPNGGDGGARRRQLRLQPRRCG
uniref:Uncharacterized protein n=1 Tax=Oryza sativa subsp. japonica TaxID=39947 RepID=Q6H6T0_ORYSJ|nr:hypothetical protein [Oryza sativa Japonica Group]BAD25569.1 hypothetical protein [Oryza sativa Japonica Group]